MTETGLVEDSFETSSTRQVRRSWRWWRNGLQILLGLGLGAAAVGYVLRDINLVDITTSLGQVLPGWVLLAVMLVGFTQGVKVLRWRLILGEPARKVSRWRLWRGLLVGQALNLLAPVRVGDVTRAYVTGSGTVGSVFTFYTVVVEKAWEVVMLLICLGVLVAWGPWPDWLSQVGMLISLASLAVIVFGLVLVWWGRAWLLAWAETRGGRSGLWLKRFVEPALDLAGSLASAAGDGRLVGMAAASLGIWVLGAATNVAVFRALGIPVHWSAALLILAAIYVGVVLPAPPARIGLFHLLVLLSLVTYGVERENALACGVLLHLVVVAPLLLAGGVMALVSDI